MAKRVRIALALLSSLATLEALAFCAPSSGTNIGRELLESATLQAQGKSLANALVRPTRQDASVSPEPPQLPNDAASALPFQYIPATRTLRFRIGGEDLPTFGGYRTELAVPLTTLQFGVKPAKSDLRTWSCLDISFSIKLDQGSLNRTDNSGEFIAGMQLHHQKTEGKFRSPILATYVNRQRMHLGVNPFGRMVQSICFLDSDDCSWKIVPDALRKLRIVVVANEQTPSTSRMLCILYLDDLAAQAVSWDVDANEAFPAYIKLGAYSWGALDGDTISVDIQDFTAAAF